MKKTKDYHVSRYRNQIHKGSARQLVDKYADMAKSARDEAQRQVFLNYKEHYCKLSNT